jgi:3-oxosteroid 1-dehydrogenase
VLDRGKPGSIIVDRTGRRFANEAVSHHEFVRAMYRANGASPSVPAWMICDRRFIARYGLGLIRPRTASLRRYIESGYLVEAAHARELALGIGARAEALGATIERFNGFARNGRDEGFGRGETIYERSSGDPKHRPNPCLGPIGDGPLYAVELHPTPLGTSRGLAADEHARVLDPAGRPIEGRYVCGNDMQSVFGGEYPGAGAQLGQAMTFAWIAAGHVAGRPR